MYDHVGIGFQVSLRSVVYLITCSSKYNVGCMMEIVMNFAITCRHFLHHFDTKILKRYLLCLDMYNDY